jgi:AraC-like DNA-binding protein
MMLELGEAGAAAPAAPPAPPRGIFASRFTDELRDACLRLVECLARPTDARILGPGVVREITYRVLATDQAHALRAVAVRHARFTPIHRVLHRIHAEFDSALSVESLAAEAAMSPSTFHENFRAVTRTSPLQYVKAVRLHKARAFMLHEGLTAAEAAARVGYESPSQFSREFKRLFGRTPAHDAAASRASLGAG